MLLDGSEDGLVLWKPAEIGGRRGGTEVTTGPRASSSASAIASAGPATMAALRRQ